MVLWGNFAALNLCNVAYYFVHGCHFCAPFFLISLMMDTAMTKSIQLDVMLYHAYQYECRYSRLVNLDASRPERFLMPRLGIRFFFFFFSSSK
jgi:hypothetical protein